MKNILVLFTIIFFCLGCNQDELKPEKVFEGDIHLLTQQDVDSFLDSCYTNVNGHLFIGDFNNEISSINNLDGLVNLRIVTKELSIYFTQVSNLNGLSNLISVGDLGIQRNDKLTDITGLKNLSSVHYFGILHNNALTDLNGLNNLTSVGALGILFNHSLENLNGLNNLSSVFNLYILDNDSLYNFCGLQTLINNKGIHGSYDVGSNKYNSTYKDLQEGNCSI